MTELLREPSRVVIDEIMNRPRGPSAEVLSDTYGQSAAENQLYGQLLKGAYEGTLGFDPIENVKDFARAADSVEESSGVGDIEIPVEQGVDSTDKASLSTILKATQQVRLARSLGYISPGRARIENGKLKVRIVRPGNNSEKGLFPKFQDGKYVDHKDAVDPEGQNIPADVVDSAQANLFVRCMDENYGIRLNITDEIKQIINQAARNKVSMPVQLVARGAVPFYRAIAEALGYHTGPLEPDIGPDGKELYGHYKIPVINRRPGFDSTAQTRSEMASPSNSTEGQEPENNQEYLGPKRNISPNILRLVTGPDSLTDLERKEALNRAQREAGLDAAQNRVVLTDGEGNEYWGA